ncbi:hypothetical protein [Anthocerotibacter panamensis]|uniref:hypothetical protein n=1 Tax=Anthocerotibacter panamensis TaxID=2857077 RepID=UPI001C404703|nr:hypothetical protein [Anthocerotibacter panamensis]
MKTLRQLLSRGALALALVGISITGTIYLLRDSLPRIWYDYRCLPTYAAQQSLPYQTFLRWVESGRVKSVLFNAEQAIVYINDPSGSYRVKLPELDLTWADILSAKKVEIIELVPGSC